LKVIAPAPYQCIPGFYVIPAHALQELSLLEAQQTRALQLIQQQQDHIKDLAQLLLLKKVGLHTLSTLKCFATIAPPNSLYEGADLSGKCSW
jgi:hypothetical protein